MATSTCSGAFVQHSMRSCDLFKHRAPVQLQGTFLRLLRRLHGSVGFLGRYQLGLLLRVSVGDTLPFGAALQLRSTALAPAD